MLRVPLLGSNFSPLQLPGLVRWLDTSDLSTLFQDSARTTGISAFGDPVGGVTDKSRSGNHFIQATAGKRPTYQQNAWGAFASLRFDGVDDFLSSTAAAYSVRTTLVAARRVAVGNGVVVSWGNPTARWIESGGWFYNANEAGSGVSLAGDPSIGTVGTFQFASTSSLVIRLNGAQVASFDPKDDYSTGTALSLGCRSDGAAPLNVDVFEAIDCSTLLSDRDVQSAERYLRRKWGTA